LALLGLLSSATQGLADSWTPASAMAVPRYGHQATLLGNGKVLVTGGSTGSGYTASAELYDPATSTWSATAAMATPRYFHQATLLGSGKVLVTGGYTGSVATASAQLYDRATDHWSEMA